MNSSRKLAIYPLADASVKNKALVKLVLLVSFNLFIKDLGFNFYYQSQ